MSSVLVVGSIALDTLHFEGGADYTDVVGGSCSYFSAAARFLAPVRVVGVVGSDFPKRHLKTFGAGGVDLTGLEIIPGRKTFRWTGTYGKDRNTRVTDLLEFGVLGEFDPKLPPAYRDTPFVFLACAQPALQLKVLKQMRRRPVAVCDTIEIYIRNDRKVLERVFKQCDGVILNDSEAAILFEDDSAVRNAKRLVKGGLRFAVVKKGEHGAILAVKGGVFPVPAYPLEKVADPTGAGDSFAGGFVGHLAAAGRVDVPTLRRAMTYGTALASFTCEGVAWSRLVRAKSAEVAARVRAFQALLRTP